MAIRVLVVEDSVLISSALRILLESNGYDVAVAGTAAEALDSGIESPPTFSSSISLFPTAMGCGCCRSCFHAGSVLPSSWR